MPLTLRAPINLLYASFGLFLLYFWRDTREIKRLKILLLAMALVVLMAFISLFFSIDPSASLWRIRQYLLEPTLFMIFIFLLVRRLHSRGLAAFFGIIFFGLFYHPLAVIYDFYANGGGDFGFRGNLAGYGMPSTVHAAYLCLALGLCVAGFIKSRRFLRAAFALAVLVCAFGIICNGGRFAFLAGVGILLSPLVFLHYRHKRKFLAAALCGITLSLGSFYYISRDFDLRFNLHNLINNLATVWATPPAAMGQFLSGGCHDPAQCAPLSLGKNSPIDFEFSTLDRLSLLKATLLAIAQNPLRPNGFSYHLFPETIGRIFPLDSPNHPFSLRPFEPSAPHFQATHVTSAPHNHNYPSAIFLELGIFGFLGVSAFFGYFFWALFKERKRRSGFLREALMLGVGLGCVGLGISNLFDDIPVRDGQLVLFVLLGAFLGAKHREIGESGGESCRESCPRSSESTCESARNIQPPTFANPKIQGQKCPQKSL